MKRDFPFHALIAEAFVLNDRRPGAIQGLGIAFMTQGTCSQGFRSSEEIKSMSKILCVLYDDAVDVIQSHMPEMRFQTSTNIPVAKPCQIRNISISTQVAEVREYQRAATLGRRNWDLFLNLGLAQLENGDLDAATDSLRQAVLLGENHAELHFNLALVYERRGLLADAEREILTSLRLNPGDPDARNSLGVIYAEEGKSVRASLVWRELVRAAPDYEPARTNLALLGSQIEVARGETAAVALPPAATVKAVQDECKLPAPTLATEPIRVLGQQSGK
jgi:tetratricopeptide (TPR) repeat protein